MAYMAYRPTKGNTWNRLRDFPRNEACFCGSGQKFKRCHAQRLLPCVTTEAAKKIQRFLDLRKAGKACRLLLEHTADPNVSAAQLEGEPELTPQELKDQAVKAEDQQQEKPAQ
jgi:hypothetical protein